MSERHVEGPEERLCLGVGSGRSYDDDIHSSGGVDTVVINFGKDQLLFEAKSKVTPPVEAPVR